MLAAAAFLLTASAWLWFPPLRRALRRARIRAQPFAQPWREILRRRMPAFARLPADVQLRLKKLAQVLIAEKPMIGCAGLQVSDEMRVLIAVQASLLLLRRGSGYYPQLRQILVYPGTFVVRRSGADSTGVVQDERRALVGESWQQGQVVLSWQDVLDGAADPHDGRNVVIHEFAHQLDQETGFANGAPWMALPQQRRAWARVLGEEFAALQRRVALGAPGLIDPYGATDPAEFFAVVSELFFERPAELAFGHSDLYTQLGAYYGVDPLPWQSSSAYIPN